MDWVLLLRAAEAESTRELNAAWRAADDLAA
jgi:hypothetical protein